MIHIFFLVQNNNIIIKKFLQWILIEPLSGLFVSVVDLAVHTKDHDQQKGYTQKHQTHTHTHTQTKNTKHIQTIKTKAHTLKTNTQKLTKNKNTHPHPHPHRKTPKETHNTKQAYNHTTTQIQTLSNTVITTNTYSHIHKVQIK